MREFLKEFWIVVRDVPAEAKRQWHEAHTRTPWLRKWDQEPCPQGGRPIILVGTEAEASYNDYKLWRTLGVVSDVLLALMLIIIGILLLLAAL